MNKKSNGLNLFWSLRSSYMKKQGLRWYKLLPRFIIHPPVNQTIHTWRKRKPVGMNYFLKAPKNHVNLRNFSDCKLLKFIIFYV